MAVSISMAGIVITCVWNINTITNTICDYQCLGYQDNHKLYAYTGVQQEDKTIL